MKKKINWLHALYGVLIVMNILCVILSYKEFNIFAAIGWLCNIGWIYSLYCEEKENDICKRLLMEHVAFWKSKSFQALKFIEEIQTELSKAQAELSKANEKK